jgi:Xaa-Pro aminopeptidase
MTVEPGIYIRGLGGVRIEDMIVIKTKGAENLTKVPKDLKNAILKV